jgi:flagellar FliL protein
MVGLSIQRVSTMAKKPKKSEDETEGAEAPPEGGSRRKLIMMGGAAVVVAAAGGGGYFFFMKSKKPAAEAAKPEPPRVVAFVDLPDMTVNLSTGSDRPQFLRMKAALEVADTKIADQIRPVMPRVVDAFQVYLREMRPADLEGSAGMFRLRDELTRRVNTAVHPVRVNAVLFREIVVQ